MMLQECNKDLYDGGNQMFPPKADVPGPSIDWTQFHTFTVEWGPTSIQWFVDGVQAHERVAGKPADLFIPQWPFYMILNTALTPWANHTRDTGFPVTHEIDRVTFCQLSAAGASSD